MPIEDQCYLTLVRPIMEYACVVWDPITQKNITELERVQRKAVRFVMGDYKTTSSARSMLEHLEWSTLEERRKRVKVTMLYRYMIIHQVVAIPAQPYLIPRGVASTTRGHCQRYQIPYSRLQCHQQSFFPSTIIQWNELPAEAVSASTVDDFKTSLPTALH